MLLALEHHLHFWRWSKLVANSACSHVNKMIQAVLSWTFFIAVWRLKFRAVLHNFSPCHPRLTTCSSPVFHKYYLSRGFFIATVNFYFAFQLKFLLFTGIKPRAERLLIVISIVGMMSLYYNLSSLLQYLPCRFTNYMIWWEQVEVWMFILVVYILFLCSEKKPPPYPFSHFRMFSCVSCYLSVQRTSTSVFI